MKNAWMLSVVGLMACGGAPEGAPEAPVETNDTGSAQLDGASTDAPVAPDAGPETSPADSAPDATPDTTPTPTESGTPEASPDSGPKYPACGSNYTEKLCGVGYGSTTPPVGARCGVFGTGKELGCGRGGDDPVWSGTSIDVTCGCSKGALCAPTAKCACDEKYLCKILEEQACSGGAAGVVVSTVTASMRKRIIDGGNSIAGECEPLTVHCPGC